MTAETEESAEVEETVAAEPEMVDTVYTVAVTSVSDEQIIACDADGNAYVLVPADSLSAEGMEMLTEGSVLTVTETAEAGAEKVVGAYTSVGDQLLVEAYTLNVTAVAAADDEEAASISDTYFAEADAEDEADFTVTETEDKTMYAKSSVNVRSGPSQDYEKLGALSWAEEVTVTGQADTGWYQIGYDGGIAYVSDNYLSETKPEKQVASTNTTTNTTGNKNSNASTGSSNQGVVYFSAWGDSGRVDIDFDSIDNSTTETTTGDGGNIEPTICTDFVGYINSLREALGPRTITWSDGEEITRDVQYVSWDDSLCSPLITRI